MGQNGQVPSQMGIMKWIPNRSGGRQATGRQIQENRKITTVPKFGSIIPSPFTFKQFFSPHKNTFLRINGS